MEINLKIEKNVPIPHINKVLTPKEVEARRVSLVEMRNSGLTLREMGEHYNLTRERVRQILKDLGMRTVRIDEKAASQARREAYILKRYHEGYTKPEIVAEQGRNLQWAHSPKLTKEDHDTHRISRFWRFVDKSTEHWKWTGATCKGYGRYRWKGRNDLAHRVILDLELGYLPEFTLKYCSEPGCIRHFRLADLSEVATYRKPRRKTT